MAGGGKNTEENELIRRLKTEFIPFKLRCITAEKEVRMAVARKARVGRKRSTDGRVKLIF